VHRFHPARRYSLTAIALSLVLGLGLAVLNDLHTDAPSAQRRWATRGTHSRRVHEHGLAPRICAKEELHDDHHDHSL
jgi:hypothetical protein